MINCGKHYGYSGHDIGAHILTDTVDTKTSVGAAIVSLGSEEFKKRDRC